ncbi:MAG: SDR family oxidoreductase [Pseudohongiellaceae bacterium]
MQRVLIAGAVSAIAKEVARLYASDGAQLFLVGRDSAKLKHLADDLTIRGASGVGFSTADLTHFAEHDSILEEARTFLDEIDIALICHGSLPDQQACEKSFKLTQQEININGLSVISLLTLLSRIFASQGKGTIAVITSVAGDRGRRSNYVYGSAKAMVSTYLQGLRGSLLPFNVHVVDIRPGFVDTPMTAGMKKGPLWVSPQRIARIIIKAVSRRKHTVYAPFFWRYIMFVVRIIPEFLFKRLKL